MTDQNWINDEIFRAWVNRTTEPNKIGLYNDLANGAFEFLRVDRDECQECPYFSELKDKYGTGDSPSELVCKGTAKTCQRQEDIKDEIECEIRKLLIELSESDLSPLVEALKEGDQFSYASLFVKILMGIEQ